MSSSDWKCASLIAVLLSWAAALFVAQRIVSQVVAPLDFAKLGGVSDHPPRAAASMLFEFSEPTRKEIELFHENSVKKIDELMAQKNQRT